MTYRYISANVLEDGLGHRVEISGRTIICFSFSGREILLSSELLTAGYGIAIYRDWSKLASPGTGGPFISDDELQAAVTEVAKALREVGTKVEIV